MVDTGSSDRTRELAFACGARVFTWPWTDDFAAARNAAFSLARGIWLFWLDADDVLPSDQAAALLQLALQHTPAGLLAQVDPTWVGQAVRYQDGQLSLISVAH